MTRLFGKIKYMMFAEGTKSECMAPYIFLENGSQIMLYKTGDNPFENKAFLSYKDKEISVEGELIDGVFEVENIIEEKEPSESEEKCDESSAENKNSAENNTASECIESDENEGDKK